MGILYIPFSGITSLFRENAHPISGKYIPNTGILYIPLSGIISLFWEKTISHFRELYPRKGKNKPIGLLQDTHFVHTKYILLGGKPPKTPFQQPTASASSSFNADQRNLSIPPQPYHISFASVPHIYFERKDKKNLQLRLHFLKGFLLLRLRTFSLIFQKIFS